MKALQGFAVWAVVVLCCLFEIAQAECTGAPCNNTVSVSTTTTSISAKECNLSIQGGNQSSIITGLQPGQVYVVHAHCSNCCFQATTKPERVTDLNITDITTSSLRLNWRKPEGIVSSYKVSWSGGGQSESREKTQQTELEISNLSAGGLYHVTVTAVAGDDLTEGEGYASSTYTKPAMPVNVTANQRNTDSLNISWTLPEGRVDHYEVQLEWEINKTNSSWFHFANLSPGRLFKVNVTAVAGAFSNTSRSTKFATYSLSPESIQITRRTNASLDLSWSIHPKMENAPNINYNITYKGVVPGQLRSTVTNATLSNLLPGSQYDIMVKTVGPEDLPSSEAKTSACTNPNPVLSLKAAPESDTSVKVEWSYPQDHKQNYSYSIVAYNATGNVVSNQTIPDNSVNVIGLDPGTNYTIAVTTQFTPECQSTKEEVWSYTRPATVTITEISGSTNDLTVSWSAAQGRVNNYAVILYNKTDQVQHKTVLNASLSTNFTGLKPGVKYCAEVVTRSGPFENNSSKSCNATFPNLPGQITVQIQTEQSLTFTWGTPEEMQSDQYDFNVTFYNGTTVTQKHASTTLKDLESGSPYNISVVTVGANNLVSQKVRAGAYTKPYPVTELQQTEITPDSVTLTWNQTGRKLDYTYLMKVSNISGPALPPINVTSLTNTAKGLMSGTNYSFSVTTQTADGTAASPNTVHYFTRPYGIRALTANPLNTTSINLTWEQPMQYKPQYKYLVVISASRETTNQTILSESIVISGLIPGTNYTFCVTVKAENGIEGESNCASQYTKPEKPEPRVSSRGSNSSMQVSWAKPEGNVEFYQVYLKGPDINLTSAKLNSSGQYVFYNLLAGRNYTVIVESQSGPFKAPSEPITNATFPNPPGAIRNVTKTTDSLDIFWNEAPNMSGANYYYRLEIPSKFQVVKTDGTNYSFGRLQSGTGYNISVTTVAAMDFESETVWYIEITTRPFDVRNLHAVPSEKSVTLNWTEPEYKDSYIFRVALLNINRTIVRNETTKNLKHSFTDLDSGTSYIFTVTTETSDGTQAVQKEISVCTDASAVAFLQCIAPNDPNATNATITWNWTKPNGRFSNFSVQFGNERTDEKSCQFKKGDLHHYENYTVTVETQSCGRPSSPMEKTCQTGITVPPVPENYETMIKIPAENLDWNGFTINIDPSLLNNSNGPVKHLGVLIAENTNALDSQKDNVEQYLEKNYNQWKAKESDAYLATMIDLDTSGKGMTRGTAEPLSIDVGNGIPWRGYLNGNLEPTKRYIFGIVLFTDLQFRGEVINAAACLFSYRRGNIVTLPQNPATIGMAVGLTLGFFCVLLIVLIGFIIYWRRLASKESSDVQIQSLSAKVSAPVSVEDYEVYYKKQKADSNCGFAEEYEDLKVAGTAQSKIHALNPENKPKNRYNNVLPYDASRVKLSIIHGNPVDDYINANYIPGYISRKEFIAAQGPLPATVNDFWRMIWEKNVYTIVMLTRCNEQGRVKCEQYWTHGTKPYGNITVTTTSEIPLDDWTIRDFDIKNVKTAEIRSVRHFHFTAWPDHGVPETTELLISFRHLVREHMDQYRHSPTVVHCSAGVGRTGTFVAIDRLIFQIERENLVDVYGIVYDMRIHRSLMVQTEDQYVFLNQCALDIIRSRTGNNVDLIYQNMTALSIYENIELQKK